MAELLTSVRFDKATLDALRAVADVHDSNVAAEVRAAVELYLRTVRADPDFRAEAAASVEARRERVDALLSAD